MHVCVCPTDFFGLPDDQIEMVLTTGASEFNSMGTLMRGHAAADPRIRVVKLFSLSALSTPTTPGEAPVLQRLFQHHTVLHEVHWDAYPVFKAPEQFNSFVVRVLVSRAQFVVCTL